LPWGYVSPLEELWDDLTRSASDADRARYALAHVTSWATANQHAFDGRQLHGHDDPRLPRGEWAGRWKSGDDWEEIAFLPHRLEAVLKEGGFDPDAIIRTWRDRGWLETGADRARLQKKVRVGGIEMWCVVVRRSSVEEATPA